MKKEIRLFAVKILLVLLPFLLLFTWIEYKARHLPNSFALKKANLDRTADSVRILILGSSHALKGINPEYFSCYGFNLSNSSQTLIHDSKLCLAYLDRLRRLKAVILDISYISFFFSLYDSPESWKEYFYYHYFDLAFPTLQRFSPQAITYTALYTKGTVNDIVFGKINYKETFGDIQPNGWERTDQFSGSGAISDETGFQRAKLHQSLINMGNFIEIMPHLDALIKSLNEREVKVILISSPVCKTYSNHLCHNTEEMNHQLISSVCRKYNIAYYDFSSDPRFAVKDFHDNDHLNSTGAEKFSRILDGLFVADICKYSPE